MNGEMLANFAPRSGLSLNVSDIQMRTESVYVLGIQSISSCAAVLRGEMPLGFVSPA